MVVSEGDSRVLEFARAHSVVLADQVVGLLEETGPEVEERLGSLSRAGFLVCDRVGPQGPDCFRITGAGLRAIGSRFAPPGFDPRCRHAVGAGWLWLAAHGGTFGSVEGVVSERQMRVEDREGGADSPFFVQPEQFGGDPERHYADLMLLMRPGRVAVELLMVGPVQRRLEAVLRAYAADARIRAVLYLVVDPRLGRLVQSAAARLELSPLVHVQPAVLKF